MLGYNSCCCGPSPGGPAVFISIGPDEDSSSDYSDTIDLGDGNPFCLMDEDVIHPKIEASKYGITNEFIEEDGMVRVGLEIFLHPSCDYQYGDCDDIPDPPQCYDLPFLRYEYHRDDEIQNAIDYIYDEIINRFGSPVLENGQTNPYPSQIWFMIDVSGSFTWDEGSPIVNGLYNKFEELWGSEIAESKFNPCFVGPSCVSWGCCDAEMCAASPCGQSSDDMRRFTYEMHNEDYMATTINLMRAHFIDTHCDQEKLDIHYKDDCWGCNNCSFDVPCEDCVFQQEGACCADGDCIDHITRSECLSEYGENSFFILGANCSGDHVTC